MIPQRLTLKNFLSYREATLDFRGLHTACICGANGAGKSSLLEAIAWAIWGESRAASEEDVIYLGASEVLVDFIFIYNQQLFRIIRSRYRGQATTLEFQVASVSGEAWLTGNLDFAALPFRPLTLKGVRSTQQLIQTYLKLDYDTFINSAYLRQGRADEFMLKRPGERKQILADLLKLEHYDALAEQAKDRSRQIKGQIDLLEQQRLTLQTQLQQQTTLTQEQTDLELKLAALKQQQATTQAQLKTIQAAQQQRQTWQQQVIWAQQQLEAGQQDCDRLFQELETRQQQQQELAALIQQEITITANYQHFQALQEQEELLASRLPLYQQLQTQRQQLQQQQSNKLAELERQIQQVQAQIDVLQQQQQDIHQTLSKQSEIEKGLHQLQQARARLLHLDQVQTQVTPLLRRQQQLQTSIDRTAARLGARLDELHHSTAQLERQHKVPQLQETVMAISDRLTRLEERKRYQQQVLEKGLERRGFMEQLQAEQRTCEQQIAAVEQKLQLLQQSSAGHTSYPPCPLCDRPLDEQHWQLVVDRHQTQQQALVDQIWTIREQLATSEREVQILRQEYRTLEQELDQYSHVLERRGQLQEQLQTQLEGQVALQQLTTAVAELEQTLQTGDYAVDEREELRLLDQRLQSFHYDEKDHALARGEVDRWRWAEIRQAELRQAHKRQVYFNQQLPKLEADLATLNQQKDQVQQATAYHLAQYDHQLSVTGYDLDRHTALRAGLRQAHNWQVQYQELCRAKQHYPAVQQQVETLKQRLHNQQQTLQAITLEHEQLSRYLAETPDLQQEIAALEQHLHQQHAQRDDYLAYLGRLQQQHQQLEALTQQQQTLEHQVQTAQRQYRVYQEVAQAFGKNGIQALMIETVLPQLEAETNQILSRLSANQLHVQFVTQRLGRKSSLSRTPGKPIETLDILIADTRGTRPYETYSGGEAFRVNFAIRLALAKLLAQRSGTALQLLIVDEGFGTQDAEGCDRLIAAINAIAPEFACILAVTHVPHFKEAFQSRIEVIKTDEGSQLQLLA